ncbi:MULTISPECIES: helicase-related protein [Mycolicibacterium]|uniref:Helicase n=1 Tax=Mycolicibacterium senegalense TaxID=1796 RepID=A0A378W422_9MYCO|nr:superfamily II DNA or RNA helicase [Mycolicibacterium senegalense]CDP85264.1 helicase [Mycolicibacterium farcinogenes]SUA27785.1 helicase [Mycolicibacterium senegalense]
MSLLDTLCECLFDDCTGFEPAEVLYDVYGARPKENFVAEAWDSLREGWLRHDKASRDRVVADLREIRNEDGHITNRRAQMEYLRELRNAKNLRAIVLQAFIDRGEVEPETLAPPKPQPPKPRPPKPTPPKPEPRKPPTGDDVPTEVLTTPNDLNVAPGSIVVVRDEEWLVTKAEQGADGWLVHVRGLSELVADTTAAFYSSLDKIEPQDPREAKVVADGSSGYRDSRLWLEALIRKTPVPYGDQNLTVSTHMLADALAYQRAAVTKALDPLHIRPRILIADAVGLGKTIEIGMILSELVRRGRGERILVVTPKHVLEQMQHELWCRFALPFVRLDSAGIQKVRQKLPATRNPFTYFKRAIISIDTLKSPRYKAHLERQQWDAVVIDESHNLTNTGTLNNELARVLAPNTEALILASATPHNGREESFAELLRLLDPTVVQPDGSFTREDVESLLIRRHRHSPDVATEVGGDWAERAEPVHRLVKPSPAEDAVAAELSQTWLHPRTGSSPYSGDTKALFPWTLAKAYLSSPAALAESIKQRRNKLDDKDREQRAELKALQTLDDLNAKALNERAGKFAALVERLQEIGVGKASPTRAVVFAERVATLTWLRDHLPKATGLAADNIAMLHGGLSDVEQQEIVDNFKLETSPIRILVTGDVASEGVNLHAQCHHLIHYDIPWSLIRIEQRNGRVDRYGQKHPPVISSLILEPSDPEFSGDLRVLSRLLERENQAHSTLGDVASLMGKHSVSEEENAIRDVLAKGMDLDAAVRTAEEVADGDDLDAFFAQFDAVDDTPPVLPTSPRQSLYPDDLTFLDEALHAAFHDAPHAPPDRNGVGWTVNANHGIAELTPPKDLRQRLGQLPQNYLQHGRVLERLKLATTRPVGETQLRKAREGKGVNNTTWPEAHYLGPLHPVLDWASDRALTALGRNQVFVIRGNVDAPTVLLMGTLTNKRGQLISRVFSTAVFPNPAKPDFCMVETLEDIGFLTADTALKPGSSNPGPVADVDRYRALIPAAVDNAQREMRWVLDAQEKATTERLSQWRKRAQRWHDEAEQLELFGAQKSRVGKLSRRINEEQRLADLLAPTQQLVRPLLVIVDADTPAAAGKDR